MSLTRQNTPVLLTRILMDPHHFGNLVPHPDPDPHQIRNQDPDPHQIKKKRIRIRIRICINVMQIQHWNTQKNNSLERAYLRNSGIGLISYPGFLLICARIHAHVGPGHVLRPPGGLRALLAPARLPSPRAVLQHQRYEGT